VGRISTEKRGGPIFYPRCLSDQCCYWSHHTTRSGMRSHELIQVLSLHCSAPHGNSKFL